MNGYPSATPPPSQPGETGTNRTWANRAWTRLALTGLAFGVAVLVVVAGMATVSTRRAIRTVETADQVTAVWNAVYIDVNQDISALNDYQRQPDSAALDLVDSRIASAETDLDWLEKRPKSQQSPQLNLVIDSYRNLTDKLRKLVAQAHAEHGDPALSIAAEAQTIATDLRRFVVMATGAQRRALQTELDQVGKDNQRLERICWLVSPIDAGLLLICAVLLLGYQRRIERLAQSSQYQARHDPLTGLGNRMLLDEELVQAVDRAENTGGSVALLLFDLNGFKAINDSLGHPAGDILLQHIGARLPWGVRRADAVGRLGGDEFAAILVDIASVEEAITVASKVLDTVQQPVDLCGTTVDVSVSIGVALYPTHCSDAQQLLQYADIAMYSAKRDHVGVAVYSEAANRNSAKQITLLGELHRAIDQHELVLYYQPKIDASTETIVGAEALVRWQHPERGLLTPAEFVPLAEQSKLMTRFTEQVLGQALRQVRQWRVPVAVNIGARCLLDRDFPTMVAQQLVNTDVPAEMLTLEITETSLISDPVQAREVLTALREFGLRLSIDDFGTGYSSMTYLITMPVQEIKIDRSFVSSMLTDPSRAQVVQAIVDLGLRLGLDVVAEGVEDAPTWTKLVSWACPIGQGYHLGRPMPSAEFGSWLSEPPPAGRAMALPGARTAVTGDPG